MMASFNAPLAALSPTMSSHRDVRLIDKDHTCEERRQVLSPLNEKTEWPSTLATTSPSPGVDVILAVENDDSVEMQVLPMGGILHSQMQPLHQHTAMILNPQGHEKRHECRSSTGGALLLTVGGTIGRHH
jgi:hypothetical protein